MTPPLKTYPPGNKSNSTACKREEILPATGKVNKIKLKDTYLPTLPCLPCLNLPTLLRCVTQRRYLSRPHRQARWGFKLTSPRIYLFYDSPTTTTLSPNFLASRHCRAPRTRTAVFQCRWRLHRTQFVAPPRPVPKLPPPAWHDLLRRCAKCASPYSCQRQLPGCRALQESSRESVQF